MAPRIDRAKYPRALKAMLALHEYLEHSTLDPVLHELVSYRASQMNGCAWCLDMTRRSCAHEAIRSRSCSS
jgi:alkylhydroperoxidase family enzyme